MNQTTTKLAVVLGAVALVSGCTAHTIGHRPSAALTAYVTCVGQFIDCEPACPWAETWVDPDGHEHHDDGSAPRAFLRIISPTNHAGRIVGLLFKYQGTDLPTALDVGAKGKSFSFELPEDFFTGESVTIDNSHVRNLKMEPGPEVGGYRR